MPVLANSPLVHLLRPLGRRVDRWSIEAQLQARRNAMVAATRLAQRRAEREEVEDYFASLATPAVADRERAARG